MGDNADAHAPGVPPPGAPPPAATSDAPALPPGERGRAAMGLLIATVSWGISPIFIRLLADAYDPWTQTLLRYFWASLALGAYCMVYHREHFLRLLRDPRPILGLALLNGIGQYCWTAGCYGVESTVANLITKLMVVLVIVLSFFVYREERRVITHPLYLGGTAVSLLGLVLVLTSDPSTLVPQFDRYTGMLVITSMTWAAYFVWAKHVVRGLHPIPMFAVICILSTAVFVPFSVAFEDIARAWQATAGISVLAALSGLLGVAASHPAYHYAQRRLGSAFCSSVTIANPLLTFVLALVFLPGETLLPTQIAGGVILVAGVYAVARAERKAPAA